MVETSHEGNARAIEAWNTIIFDVYTRMRPVLTTGLARHGEAVFEHHPPREGERVLDVGCGFGDTTIALAKLVGPRGEAVGVDAASRFIDVARREAADMSVQNARYLVGDAQEAELEGPYDRVFSRFGAMFFADQVRALANLRRSLRPGGLLSMVVWRRKDENAFFHEVEQRVLEIVPRPEKSGGPTFGPGPFAMASPDVASAQLLAAGFTRPTFERFDTDICMGKDVDQAVELAMSIGPAGEILRLAGEAAKPRRPAVAAALRDLLASRLREGGVFCGSSSWIVTARA